MPGTDAGRPVHGHRPDRRQGRDRHRQNAADSDLRRTSVLAFDTSNSMAGAKFTQAKAAALSYLDAVPDNVYVGMVTFDDSVDVAREPTLNRDDDARRDRRSQARRVHRAEPGRDQGGRRPPGRAAPATCWSSPTAWTPPRRRSRASLARSRTPTQGRRGRAAAVRARGSTRCAQSPTPAAGSVIQRRRPGGAHQDIPGRGQDAHAPGAVHRRRTRRAQDRTATSRSPSTRPARPTPTRVHHRPREGGGPPRHRPDRCRSRRPPRVSRSPRRCWPVRCRPSASASSAS